MQNPPILSLNNLGVLPTACISWLLSSWPSFSIWLSNYSVCVVLCCIVFAVARLVWACSVVWPLGLLSPLNGFTTSPKTFSFVARSLPSKESFSTDRQAVILLKHETVRNLRARCSRREQGRQGANRYSGIRMGWSLLQMSQNIFKRRLTYLPHQAMSSPRSWPPNSRPLSSPPETTSSSPLSSTPPPSAPSNSATPSNPCAIAGGPMWNICKPGPMT